jgi:signal recognition particle GTPase
MRKLEKNDISLIKSELKKALSQQMESIATGTGQKFGYEFLDILVSKLALPILTGLASSYLYETLKGKKLDSLSKSQADNLSYDMIGKEIYLTQEIDQACLDALRQELMPLGVSEEIISDITKSIKNKLLAAQKKTIEN